MWPGEGGEEDKKKRTVTHQSIPNPGCLACQHPPTHQVQGRVPSGPSPSGTGRTHPTCPTLQAHPVSTLQIPPGTGSAWFSGHRSSPGRLSEPLGIPPRCHGKESPPGASSVASVGLLGRRGDAEPRSDAGCRARKPSCSQSRLLPNRFPLPV